MAVQQEIMVVKADVKYDCPTSRALGMTSNTILSLVP